MGKSKIEWTDKVWNPVTGCTKVSDGCRNCYAERMSKRLAGRCGYPAKNPFSVTLHHNRLDEPLKWKKPQRIFVCSMGDLFHEDVPRDFINAVWATFAEARHHTFLVLTKRPARMLEFMKGRAISGWRANWQNIHLGVSVEDQTTANERIPLLLDTPAAKRFISLEPMLEPVELDMYSCSKCRYVGKGQDFSFTTGGDDYEVICPKCFAKEESISEASFVDHLDQVILGGESGPGARPMHPDWARKVRDDCSAAGVPFFLKQWGEWAETQGKAGGDLGGDMRRDIVRIVKADGATNDGHFRRGDVLMRRIGKKAAGSSLDGEEHKEVAE